MNIQEAKTEISNTIRAYLQKDELGRYLFPTVRQRPILLMGPPGLGKTAIMQQLSFENNIPLVSYTMTHHTRQSAVGLPIITQRSYGDMTFSATEYTMSEIVAEIYQKMEQTGSKEGILFLDEINCVSETLTPTMLQLLQNKTFGNHKLPEGWIIVAAGNPQEYNKSAREFDVVTLDRIRQINVTPDVDAFLAYSADRDVHGAIVSYLGIYPEKFYRVSISDDRLTFVTARGWEDLSQILHSYEQMGIDASEELVSEYLCFPDLSREFYSYYSLYRKYGTDYGIVNLLDGTMDNRTRVEKLNMAQSGDFTERYTVVNHIAARMMSECRKYQRECVRLDQLYETVKSLIDGKFKPDTYVSNARKALETKKQFSLLEGIERETQEWVQLMMEKTLLQGKEQHLHDDDTMYEWYQQKFGEMVRFKDAHAAQIHEMMERAFTFLGDAFGNGQEITLMLTEMSNSKAVMGFIIENGCDFYLKNCEQFLFHKNEMKLVEICKTYLGTN